MKTKVSSKDVDEEYGVRTNTRLHVVDCLRGLLLMIVLVDHCDAMAGGGGFIREWTLVGVGFSDAADGFVFLSGFTFGWVFTTRFQLDGAAAAHKVLFRTTQIYFGFCVTSVCIAAISNLPGYPIVSDQTPNLSNVLLLQNHQFGLEILCLYIVCLPITAILLFVACLRTPGIPLAVSILMYAIPQFSSTVNFPHSSGGWYFNPFAWQLLMVAGSLLGMRARMGGSLIPRPRVLNYVAVGVVVAAFLAKKGSTIFDSSWFGLVQAINWKEHEQLWIGKTNLGPLRVLHFFSLVQIFLSVPQLSEDFWRRKQFAPLRACGRNSLPIYCIGVILAHGSGVAFSFVGTAPSAVLLITSEACVLQFLAAQSFERIRAYSSCIGSA